MRSDNKYPDDDIRRAGPAPPYDGNPHFRFRHEVREREFC
jgi:hypothetical protein